MRAYVFLNKNKKQKIKSMKRLNLLQATTNEKSAIQNLERKVTREKENLEFEITKLNKELKEKQDKFEDRMGAEEVFDVNEVEISFAPIKKLQERINTFQFIIDEYYTEKA